MKRSQINYIIDKAHVIAQTFRACLPESVCFTVNDWLQWERDNWRKMVNLQLGWDITDSGRGDFGQTGLTPLTIRNGVLESAAYPRPCAREVLQAQQDQQTPWHFHTHKMGDTLNRGGGDLCIQLAWANEANLCDDQRVITVSAGGQRRTMKPDETLVLKPGQDICLPPHPYHRFWAEKVLILDWKISMVNDDQRNSHPLGPGGRFLAIEEGEPVK